MSGRFLQKTIFIFLLIFLKSSICAVSEYDVRIKSSLTPSMTMIGDKLIIVWVRDDGFIKIGVGEVDESSKKVEIEYNDTLNKLTNYSPVVTSYGKDVVLAYIDDDNNIRFVIYKYKTGKLKEVSDKILTFQVSSTTKGGSKPIDIYMKEKYIFASWISDEGMEYDIENRGTVVLACFSLNNGKIKTETRKVLEGFTYRTSPMITLMGSYLYATWVDENGEVILLPITLTATSKGIKMIQGSVENIGLYSVDYSGELNELPTSIVEADDENLYLFWYNGNDEKVNMRTFKPGGDSIGYFIDEDIFVKKIIHYDTIIYNDEPHILWIDDYGFSDENFGVYPVKLGSFK